MLNIFYQEPDPDRWIKFDRYPRKIIRRLIRGKQRPGGVMMVALQLLKGLDRLGITYRFNDFKYARNHPNELIGVIGKPNLIFENQFKNPILFGAGVFSHPIECPDLFEKYPNVKKILVPGNWMKEMFIPYYGNKVAAWPAGIDTDFWADTSKLEKTVDFLIYFKQFENRDFLNHITTILEQNNKSFNIIEYGKYVPADLVKQTSICKAAIFLSNSETQGFAYQQILSANIPILAYDSAGYWLDPHYFPHKVKYKPISSVPYWSDTCGEKFKNLIEFENKLILFLSKIHSYTPRVFILNNLSLEVCSKKYIEIYRSLAESLEQ
ncbi:hypothetical protein ACJVDH_15055 [Pedobacter sp. AW1-32]|uniref:hypothetical protein n=1 Tax=Pedobacter sp. AW1-32 TaxID=3383026 RepID=UPI003FF0C996